MLKDNIRSAVKELQADLVIANISVVDVFSQDVFVADVAVKDGFFTGIGEYRGYGKEEIDGSGKYIIPGFIDAHAHIESTLVTPVEYSNTSLPHGITGVVADPHEIANVSGIPGIMFMIESAKHVPMDVYVMLPSCVPATPFENSGATLRSGDLKPLYGREGVYGLAEVMDFQAVLQGDPDMLQKLADADGAGCRIDGHAAGFDVDRLNAYAVAGIRTDHECDTAAGLTDRVRRGIYTLVREGTVCKDLLKMLPAVNEKNSRMLCFATDDKHLDDLHENGGVDFNVRLAIANGLNPATAIQMASLNAAECYRLRNIGAIAPGYQADFSIVSDLRTLPVEKVYKKGRLVAEDGRIVNRVSSEVCPPPAELVASVNIPRVSEEDLGIDMKGGGKANIIEIEEGSVVTRHLVEEVDVVEGKFRINVDRDLLKIAVVERHKNLGHIATAIIKGLQLKRGAIATTVSHDSHNLITVGTTEADMVVAIEAIRKMQGGIVVVDGGRVVSSLKLEICGLITSSREEEVLADLERLQRAVSALAPTCSYNPFLALSFMSLVVIPHLKISDTGLFEFESFGHIDVPVRE
jgi:adenine deaminase